MAVFFAAISWFVEDSFGSTMLVSLVISSGYILTFFVMPWIGRMVDSHSCKTGMNVIYLLGVINALFFLLMMKLLNGSALLFSIIIFSTGVFTIIRASDQVIRSTYISRVISKNEIYNANRYLELTRQGITFLSGGVAFFILQEKSIVNVCIVNVLCFSLSLLINFLLKKDVFWALEKKDAKVVRKGNFDKGKDFFIGTDKRYVLLFSIFPYVCVVSMNTVYPALFSAIGAQVKDYALLVIPYGLGAIVGSMIDSSLYLKNLKSTYVFFGAIMALGLLLPFVFMNIYSIYLCAFFIALSHSHIRVRRNTMIMHIATESELGRVLSFNEMLFIACSVFLSLGLGVLSDFSGFWYAWSFIIFLNVFILFIIWQLPDDNAEVFADKVSQSAE